MPKVKIVVDPGMGNFREEQVLCSKREVFSLHFLKLNCLGTALLTSTAIKLTWE